MNGASSTDETDMDSTICFLFYIHCAKNLKKLTVNNIVTDCRSNRFPGNTVPLLLNGKRNRCICGNEYVPLLVIDDSMQTLVMYSNVPTQRNTGRIVVLSIQPFVNQLLASLRRGKTESVISEPSRRKDVKSYRPVFEERRHQEKLFAGLQGEKI
jgi:hypothetical protein